MASPTPLEQWHSALDSVGADPELTSYLAARGIERVNVMALVASNPQDLLRAILDPWIAGYNQGPVTHRLTAPAEDVVVLSATVEALWMYCKDLREQALLRTPPPSQSAAGAGALALLNTPASAVTKTPKKLPDGLWSKQIQKYQSVLVDGIPRTFPEKVLLGAEAPLARLWHEHTVSKEYTPLKLGEIMTLRSFTVIGDINPIAAERSTKKVKKMGLTEDGELEQQDEAVWDPRSMSSIVDALDSVKWAFIFVELCPTHQLEPWFEFLLRMVRKHNRLLQQFKKFYDSASWRICMGLRMNRTFLEVTKELMSDVAYQQEFLLDRGHQMPQGTDEEGGTQLGKRKTHPGDEGDQDTVKRPRNARPRNRTGGRQSGNYQQGPRQQAQQWQQRQWPQQQC